MFRPYALEVGKVALEWNKLQDHLCMLFWATLGVDDSNDNALLAYKVWHSTPNDRSQREMLRAAAEVTFATEAVKSSYPKALDDTLWLLDRAQTLADRRNDALHSPFIVSYFDTSYSVQPNVFLGHPRARKFEGKNVLAELKWYRDCAVVLSTFAYQLFYILKIERMMREYHGQKPWPERPTLPVLARSKSKRKAG